MKKEIKKTISAVPASPHAKFEHADLQNEKLSTNTPTSSKLSCIPIKLLTKDVLLQIEKILGRQIEDLHVLNRQRFSLSINGAPYEDSFLALLERVRKEMNLPRLAQARLYLSRIKSNHADSNGIEDIQNSGGSLPICFLSAELVNKIELALSKKIECIPVNCKKQIALTIDGKYYHTNFRSILRLICKEKGFEQQSQARTYLVYSRDGKVDTDAIKATSVSKASRPNKIPIDMITADICKQIEAKLNRPISDISVTDHSQFTIIIRGISYTTNFNALLSRIMNDKGLATQGEAKQYLRSVISGKDESVFMADICNTPKIILVDMINPDLMRKIESALGKKIEDLSSREKTQFIIDINGKKYSDNFQYLLLRIWRKTGLQPLFKCQQYLTHIRDGKSEKNALELARNAIRRFPVDRISKDIVNQIESSLGGAIENIPTSSETPFIVQYNGFYYEDNFHNLLQRIMKLKALSFMSRSRIYLKCLGDGLSEEEALAQANETKQKIPTILVSTDVVRQIEAQLNCKIESLDVLNAGGFTVKIGNSFYEDKFNRLLLRIYRANNLTGPSSSRLYLVYIGQGKTQDEALYLVQNPGAIERKQQNLANDAMKDIFE